MDRLRGVLGDRVDRGRRLGIDRDSWFGRHIAVVLRETHPRGLLLQGFGDRQLL
jgi:hypothetical protein